ncbi:hypothetical protein Tco_1068067 [Tanacetum coccineum]|uniref:Uncharacterized protein n=1 Tax=Tanacetum coccineum TaxID=301880 RepID=A0ABQ5HF98_9ASTR
MCDKNKQSDLVSKRIERIFYLIVFANTSSASSAVTYTSVYTDSEPGRVFWGADEEISDGGPEHPPSPDYVSGPKHPPSPVYLPYIPEPEYPEYLVPSDDEAPMEDQPLPVDASPVALSMGYVPNSDLEEDQEEDSEEEHADYPADGGDGDDEPSDGDDEPSDDDDDDDDTDDEDEEPFEDEDDDEEEEQLRERSLSLYLSPQIRVPFAQTRLRRARKTVRLEPPMLPSMEARIVEHAAAPTPPLPVASSPLPLPSPLTTSPTDAGAPLGYRAAGIRMRVAVVSPPLLLPSTSHRTDIPKAEMPPQKRACFATPAPKLEIEESSATGAARQPGPTSEADTWDEIVEAMMDIRGLRKFQVRFERNLMDRGRLLRYLESTHLFRDRPYHCHIAIALSRPKKMPPKRITTRATPAATTTPTTTVTNAQLQALIDRGIAVALAERDASRS